MFCLEILPAFEYLHDLGLAFCDFKPDNVIRLRARSSSIDLGGGTEWQRRTATLRYAGYQAPEIARTGPTSQRICSRSDARWPCWQRISSATGANTSSRCLQLSEHAALHTVRLALPFPRASDRIRPGRSIPERV